MTGDSPTYQNVRVAGGGALYIGDVQILAGLDPTFNTVTVAGDVFISGRSGNAGVFINGVQVLTAQQPATTAITVTYTANAPSIDLGGLGLTIADGDNPTNAELLLFCRKCAAAIRDLQNNLVNMGITGAIPS